MDRQVFSIRVTGLKVVFVLCFEKILRGALKNPILEIQGFQEIVGPFSNACWRFKTTGRRRLINIRLRGIIGLSVGQGWSRNPSNSLR